MIHYNALAERWRFEMHMELEGAKTISERIEELQSKVFFFDHVSSGLLTLSLAALVLAGIFAI